MIDRPESTQIWRCQNSVSDVDQREDTESSTEIKGVSEAKMKLGLVDMSQGTFDSLKHRDGDINF